MFSYTITKLHSINIFRVASKNTDHSRDHPPSPSKNTKKPTTGSEHVLFLFYFIMKLICFICCPTLVNYDIAASLLY